MIEIIRRFFDSTGLGPHGMCLVWREDLLALHVFSDALIALSYFTIPFFLFVVAYRRRDLVFRGAFHQFSAFILLCGLTHIVAIWVMWNPDYVEFGLLKFATGLVSATTAVTLWKILPQVLAMPSQAQLRQANLRLEREAHEFGQGASRNGHPQPGAECPAVDARRGHADHLSRQCDPARRCRGQCR